MAKNPANRYASAEDLRADLLRFGQGQRVLAEPVLVPPVADATVVSPAVDATRVRLADRAWALSCRMRRTAAAMSVATSQF